MTLFLVVYQYQNKEVIYLGKLSKLQNIIENLLNYQLTRDKIRPTHASSH